MSTSKILRWVSGGLEAILGIPLLGGLIVIGFLYVPLLVMLALHITTLVYMVKEGVDKSHRTGSILGIITSCIAWIPFIGMILHIASAAFLLVSAASKRKISNEV